MDSREQFEAWLTTQNKERLSRGFPAYNGSDASMFMDVWQASREALVVDLPDWFVTHNEPAMFMGEVHNALDAAGIKWK